MHTRIILTHKKRREEGSNRRSISHDSNKIPQSMRNMKNSILEEPLIHFSIWIRNDIVMNEENDEGKGSRRSLPMKRINISIQLSFHNIVWLCIFLIFSWCGMHVWVFAFILLNCTRWVRSQWCCTTFHYYLSILKPICWNIRSSRHS